MCKDPRDQRSTSPINVRSTAASQLLSFITNEVQKCLQTKRVSEQTIRELDQKIQMEVYLREKKEAILEDRRIANGPEYTSLQNQEEDMKSNLEKVQEKYANVAYDLDNYSRRSVAGSKAGGSIAPGQVGSKASNTLNRDRLKDFNDENGDVNREGFFNTVSERLSCVSGLHSEIDEWGAINKLQILKAHQSIEQKKAIEKQRKEILREELLKQQQEFKEKKLTFRQDQLEYARQCDERSKREEAIERAKAEAKAKKIDEIKKWRSEQSISKKAKLEQEKKNNLQEAAIAIEKDVKMAEDATIQSHLKKKKDQEYWWAQYETIHQKKKRENEELKSQKLTEAEEAFQRSQIPFYEKIKLEVDQKKRQEQVNARINYFSNSVQEKEKSKVRLRDKLTEKYEMERELKLDAEELRKTQQSEQYKEKILKGLHEQTIANRIAAIEEKNRQDNLDKHQIKVAVERDDALKEIERKKVDERRRLGNMWMRKAEEQYQKKIENAANGANRGQKMSLEEIKYNKNILKTVSENKKAGHLSNIFEKCAINKITNFE